ncbi:MAG: peptidoglycan-binding domain-containing protein [Terriglobia bacterium]
MVSRRIFVISFGILIHMYAQGPLTPEQRKEADALNRDLAKQCQASAYRCRVADSRLLLQAQSRLAEWGYGTKFTGEPDAETTAAIRLYQQRNHLGATGKLDGETIVLMDADEKAVEDYPFRLPPFYFDANWPTTLFMATGVFQDKATGHASGPIEIWCDKDISLCLEEESTKLTPAVAKMTVKEWTDNHIVAEETAACFTNQLRIERLSRSVTHTSFKTSSQGACESFEKLIGNPLDEVYSEQLVDGIGVQIERSRMRADAIRRVELFSGTAQSLLDETKK